MKSSSLVGEHGGLVVEPWTPEREVGGSIPTTAVLCLSEDTFTPRKVLVIARKKWLRPDMTEKLFTGTLSHNKYCKSHFVSGMPFETTTIVKQEIIEESEETEIINNPNKQFQQDGLSEAKLDINGDMKTSVIKKAKLTPKKNKLKPIKPKTYPAILIPYTNLISKDSIQTHGQYQNQVGLANSDRNINENLPKQTHPVALNVANGLQLPQLLTSDGGNDVMKLVNFAHNVANDCNVKKVVFKPKRKAKKSGFPIKLQQTDNKDNDNPLICKYCSKLCGSLSQVNEHKFIHTGTGLHQCEVCKQNFTSEDALKEHVFTHEESKGLVCPVCKKSFKMKYYLDNHVGCDASGRPYKCGLCDKSYKLRYQLTVHMKHHTGEYSVRCPICGKGYPQSANLKLHLLSHSGERPFICEICGKSFPVKGCLNVHRQTHSGERPYSCEHCEKSFPTRGGLYGHKRSVHPTNPEKTHKCDICDKEFLMPHQLRQHQKRHDGTNRSQCDVCGKKFASETTLKKHNLIHTDSKPHQCETCGMRFRQIVAKQTHMLLHTGAKPLSCKICDMKFRHRSTLSNHMRKHEKLQQSDYH